MKPVCAPALTSPYSKQLGITVEGSLADLVDRAGATGSGLPDPAQVVSWKPPFSGDLPLTIHADGRWVHEGRQIRRVSLVCLFAALLRREADGCYYLVTPVEKWRITVEEHALQVVDLDYEPGQDADTATSGEPGDGEINGGESPASRWVAVLATGGRWPLENAAQLRVPELEPHPVAGTAPYIVINNGLNLTARIQRAAWYRLIDSATFEGNEAVVYSAGQRLLLGRG